MRKIKLKFDAKTVCAAFINEELDLIDSRIEGRSDKLLAALGVIVYNLNQGGISKDMIEKAVSLALSEQEVQDNA